MGISGALSSALSGLTAATRRAEVVSGNVANAATDGYAPRSVALASRSLGETGAGVRVVSVQRSEDLQLNADRRSASAASAGAGLGTAFLSDMQRAIGTPDLDSSLSAHVSRLETALISAASRPDSMARLTAVADDAGALAARLNALGDTVQDQRQRADAGIADAVGTVNEALSRIVDLNATILNRSAKGQDTASLMDERHRLIDRVAETVPVREIARDHGQIALFTTGGAILLDGRAARLGFEATNRITADMASGGPLSGLTLNGRAIDTSATGPLGGGTLSARFDIRDRDAPELQARLDTLASDLVQRLSAPGLDPTLAPGAPGLLTDNGQAVTATTAPGLAGRLTVNASVNGAEWRLRDGLGATAPGEVGDASLLTTLRDALTAPRAQPDGSSASASGLTGDLVSALAVDRRAAEDRKAAHSAEATALTEAHLAQGVDTDAELQNLLLVEQAFQANARVLATLDGLIRTLLERS